MQEILTPKVAPVTAKNGGWQYWEKSGYYQEELRRRALGDLPEMESAKQISRLVANVFEPGDRILDAGCGTGHYLNSLTPLLGGPFEYTGLDITPQHIAAAREIYDHRANVDFQVGDVRRLSFADKSFEISICANTIPHIPQASLALRELMRVTSKALFVRMLVGNETLITKKAYGKELDDRGEPVSFGYVNIYTEEFILGALETSGESVDFIQDEYDPGEIKVHHERHSQEAGVQRATRIVNGCQFKNYLLLPWKVVQVMIVPGN